MESSVLEIIKARIHEKHQGDEKQLDVIFSPEKRILVEAPAGYGKTHTMVSRIAYLIASNEIPSPKRLLALTFSVNAAYKIKKDVSKNIPVLLDGIGKEIKIKDKTYVSNYHGFCRKILKKYGQKLHPSLLNLDTLQSIDDSDTSNLMQFFKSLSLEDAELLSEFNISVKDIKGKKLSEKIERYNEIVISELLPKGAIPFNAIITLTIKLFKDFPNILSFYQNYYTTLLIDEFQDTNILSYWLLHYLIIDKTNVIFLGDSLQRIYGFIGAIPNLLKHAKDKFKLKVIALDKNYRFESNSNMLQLDKIIRQNALTPFANPDSLKSEVEFAIYDEQSTEALEVVKKTLVTLQNDQESNLAILVKQRGPNVDLIIETFKHNKIPFFYGLFTDEDANYINFNRKCLYEFIELIKDRKRITKKLGKAHTKKIREIFSDDNTALIQAMFELLDVFWLRLFIDYSFLTDEDRINLVKDTFEHNGLKQFMEFLDSKIVISTVHAAKGLEWDYVILPDMEQDLFPNWFGLCGKCKNSLDCNILVNKDNENKFLEELSVFYVAVTRARKKVSFSASELQLTKYNPKKKNISCFMKLPGMELSPEM
ncbi:UvrD-helicase domain-containing protein [Carboxylicivirga linearis]|uniref:DNA 3'-5' helicase n=1 Tax=Carboxylicivirga linearis TaxID=1628157 RepID=A0ABS5K1P2_9BACT|nr:ATP-dependent helicase [Carboxylicivirga linearis]MBS2101082.1 ATP-dependent helicase [Carboxylicivirga linearis]